MILSTPTKKIYNNQNTSYVNACILPLLSVSVLLLLLLLFGIRISVVFVVVPHAQCFPCEFVVVFVISVVIVVVWYPYQ